MASESTARSDPERLAAERGEPTRLTPAGRNRIALRIAALVAVLLVLVPLHYLFRLLSYGSPFPKIFLAAAARIVGARVRINGTPLRRDVVFIANHISWVDILALAGATGTAFVAKAELGDVPVIGWLARLNRTVFVKRENRLGVAQQINDLREALSDNWSITIFPEGTVTDGHSLLPFKTSMLRILEPPPPGILVQPVVIDYGSIAKWIGWTGDESGLNNAKRVLARKGSFPVQLHFLEPFSPADHPGRKAIAHAARHQIAARLTELLGKPLRPYPHRVEAVRYPGDRSGQEIDFPVE